MDGVVTVLALDGFDVFVDDQRLTPSAPKPRQILALLSLRCGEVVHVDMLVDELWGDHPPRGATAALQTHVYGLRKDLQSVSAGPTILTRRNGYVLDLPLGRIDVTRFEDELAAGAGALVRQDPVAARAHLVQALQMSSGRPLANVVCGSVLSGHVMRLQEARLRATELRVEADLLLGREDEVIGELRVAAADHPFHEGFVLKLMTALWRRGRRAEALEAYRALRRRLVDELGVEPGADIQDLHREVMRTDVAAARPDHAASGAHHAPALLPPDVDDLIGRDDVVGEAVAQLREPRGSRRPPTVAITGMAGVGKTATAIHVAHIVRDQFPDGQFYLSRASGTTHLNAEEISEILAHACGAAADEPDAAVAFRAWCRERRVLVVLDDVAAPETVDALLQDFAASAAIVTSRSDCDVPSAWATVLHPLDTDAGISLLSRLLQDARVETEPAAAKGVVEAVGGLPLALRQIARRLTSVPGTRLETFLLTLANALDHQPLSDISAVGPGLHERLHSAYLELPDADRHSFRLLALLPASEFTTDDAARAFLLDPVRAEMALLRLADAHMVRPHGDGRYSISTLLRHLALECLTTISSGSGPACRGPRPRCRGSRPAPCSAR